MVVTPVTDEALSDTVYAEYQRLGTWIAVGKFYGVHRAVVWRIVNQDYVPKRNDLRRKLGLPEILQQSARRDPKGRFAKSIG